MHHPEEEIILNFHCGVCAKQLTDAACLFTTCGHFFCYTQQATCTRLDPSTISGRCEQCGAQCEVGTLANRAKLRDAKVQSYIFTDLVKDLQTAAAIIDFRDKHLKILSENVAAQQKRLSHLKAQHNAKLTENQDLRRENKQLRSELTRQKNMRVPTINLESPTLTRSCKPKDSERVTVVQLDSPARTSVPQAGKPTAKPSDPIRLYRRTKPNTRTRTFPEQTYDRSLRTRSINKRRESQSLASRLRAAKSVPRKDHAIVPPKRNLADRSGTEIAYRSSKAGIKESLSRFRHHVGESTDVEQEPYIKRQRFTPCSKGQSVTGGWQRKVSNVPRPSATPDKLRRRGKRSVFDVNPLGRRY